MSEKPLMLVVDIVEVPGVSVAVIAIDDGEAVMLKS